MKIDTTFSLIVILTLAASFCNEGFAQTWTDGVTHAQAYALVPDLDYYCVSEQGETHNFMTQIMQHAGMGWLSNPWHCETLDPVFGEALWTYCNSFRWPCNFEIDPVYTIQQDDAVPFGNIFENPNDSNTDSEWWQVVWSGNLREYGATTTETAPLLHAHQMVSFYQNSGGTSYDHLMFIVQDESPPETGTVRTFDARFCSRTYYGGYSNREFQSFKESYRSNGQLPTFIDVVVFDPIGGPEIPNRSSMAGKKGGSR